LFEGEASIAKSSTAKTTLRQIGDDDLRVLCHMVIACPPSSASRHGFFLWPTDSLHVLFQVISAREAVLNAK